MRNTIKLLITGATGFIGSTLVKTLVNEGCDVGIIIRPTSNIEILSEYKDLVSIYYYDGTIESLNFAMVEHAPELVFHLASLFIASHNQQDITLLINSNLLFSTHLVDAMVTNKCHRLINTGTSWQHFDNHDYDPVCLYAATKQAFEVLLEFYINVCDLKVITLKLFDTYGKHDPRPKILALLKELAKTGGKLDMSPGEQFIDLVHIDDVVRAFEIAAERLMIKKEIRHEKYFVSSGTPLSLQELVAVFSKVVEKEINIKWGGRPYRKREVMIPWSNGQIVPGWKPRITFEKGLQDLIKYT